jgi:hypothetical protein
MNAEDMRTEMFLPPLANGSYEIAPVEVKIIAGKYFGP